MVIHIALFKWKPEIGEDSINKLIEDVKNLKKEIPEIIDIHAGENFSKWAKSYTHAVIVSFNSKSDLDIYRNHPSHKPVTETCDSYEADSIGFDFES